MSDTMSIIATAQSTAASVQATLAEQAARRAECAVVMKGYQNEGASVEQARSYASCVYEVYGRGKGLPHEAVVFMKVGIVVILLCMVIGAWKGWTDKRDPGFGSAVLTSLGGALAGLGLVIIGGAVMFVVT